MSVEHVRALLVEDNPEDVRLIREMLAEGGDASFHLEHVDRLSAGLECVAEGGVDVVLLDLGLPDSQGVTSFAQFHRQAPGVPVVVLSGLQDEALAVETVQNGAQDYLVKGQVYGNLLVRAARHAIERKRGENALRASRRFLEIVNRHTEMSPLLKEIVAEVKKLTGVAAVGVRILDAQGNIPYQAYEGFSQGFYESESPLSIHSDHCMCINAIKGTTDPQLPFYTAVGSFYMNGTTRFLATVSEEEKGQTRNVCNQTGYESVALVPIRLPERILGLIHLADPREGMVPLEMVKVLEGIATELGMAIQRVRTEEKLDQERYLMDTLMEHVPDNIYFKDTDSRFIRINPALARYFGLGDPAQAVGKTDADFFAPENAQQARADELEVMRSGQPLVGKEEKEAWADGRETYVSTTKLPLYDQAGKIIGTCGISRDISERKRAEMALRESEERYRSLFERVPLGLYRTTPEGRIREANATLLEMLGYADRESLFAVNAADIFVDPTDREREWALPNQAEVLQYETRLQRRDGRVIWVRDAFRAIRDSAGKVIYHEGSLEDITERKRMGEALAEERRKLKEAESLGRFGHWEYDVGTQKITWSDEAYVLYNRDPSLGPPTAEEEVGYYSPEQAKLLHDYGARAIQTGERFAYDLVANVPGRGMVHLSASMQPLKDDRGRIVKLFGTIQDITERKREEEERERTLRWQQGVSTVQQSLLATELLEDKLRMVTEGIVRLFDADFARIWLIRPGDLCEGDCIHAGAREGPHVCRFRDRCLHLMASSGRYTHTVGKVHRRVPFGCYKIGRVASDEDHKFVTNDVQNDPRVHDREWARELGLVSFAGYQLRAPGEETLGVLALFAKHPIVPGEDAILDGLSSAVALAVRRAMAVDAQGITEAQLLQAQKMELVGRLAGGVAHDFNNLLTVVSLYSQLALNSLDATHPLRHDLEEIRKAGERAATLTRQLLAFSRRQVLEMRVLNLNEVLEGLSKMLPRLLGEDIAVEMSLAPDLGRTRADPGQIEQVVVNLAVNARDAMPNGGRLILETANVTLDERYAQKHAGAIPGDYVLLAVSDTGSGMSAEVKAHLFEPFFTTKGVGKGTGLGLATVYGIVKQHQGHISVYSEPGQGTTFRVYLPRVKEEAEVSAPTVKASAMPRGSETVLVAEDEWAVRGIAVRVLKGLGYTVLEASNGTEALQVALAPGQKIDLLLSDVIMPEMNGKALAERFAVLWPGLKVLFVSGYTDETIARQGILDEGRAFLPKPFSPEALARKVREVLDRPDSKAANAIDG